MYCEVDCCQPLARHVCLSVWQCLCIPTCTEILCKMKVMLTERKVSTLRNICDTCVRVDKALISSPDKLPEGQSVDIRVIVHISELTAQQK